MRQDVEELLLPRAAPAVGLFAVTSRYLIAIGAILTAGVVFLLNRTSSDPGTNKSAISLSAVAWEVAPSLPLNLIGMQGGVYDEHLFVLGGATRIAPQTPQSFGLLPSTSLLSFSKKAGWSTIGHAPTWPGYAIDDSGSAVLEGKLYLMGGVCVDGPNCYIGGDGISALAGGGRSGVGNASTMMSYDIVDGKWNKEKSMPTMRRGLITAADEKSGKLYAVGGMNCRRDCYGEDVVYLSTIEVFDKNANTWSTLPSMPTPRREPVAFVVDEKLIVVGGCNNPSGSSTLCNALDVTEVLDLKTMKWSKGPSLSTARHGFGLGICPATESGIAVIAFGGSSDPGIMNNPTPTGSTEMLFWPSDGSSPDKWVYVGEMSVPRYGLEKGYGLSIDGFVFSVGGSTSSPGELEPSAVVEKISCKALYSVATAI